MSASQALPDKLYFEQKRLLEEPFDTENELFISSDNITTNSKDYPIAPIMESTYNYVNDYEFESIEDYN